MNTITAVLAWVVGKFFGNSGQPVSNALVNTASIVTALTPVALWLMKYDDTAAVIFSLPPWFDVTFTWGQFAFIFVIVFAVLKLAHWTKSPAQG